MPTSLSHTEPIQMEHRYSMHQGLHVLRLSGSDYEMGFQHGHLLREAVHRGVVPFFADYLHNMLNKGMSRLPAAALASLCNNIVGPAVARQFPAYVKDTIAGFVDGSQLPLDIVMRAYIMPDTFLWLASKLISLRGIETAPRLGVPLLGCASAVAFGEATPDGTLYHGRNLDYIGIGYWDQEPAVIFHEPNDGQAYASITSAGVLLGGVTAMNAAGLTLAVHQHIASTDTTLGAVPVGVVGDQIMRYAQTLDDARKMLDEYPTNASWTYIIGSGSENAMLCYEIAPSHRAWFMAERPVFGYTNIYLDKRMAPKETHFYPSQWRWHAGRLHCIDKRLRESYGQITADTMAGILGDRTDARCRIRHALASLVTVSSAVFQPREGLFYVATGRAPVSNQPFAAFNLRTRAPETSLPPLTGGLPADPVQAEAFTAYRQGFEAYFNHHKTAEARQQVLQACRLQPNEPLYAYVSGLLALNEGLPGAALQAFDRALQLGHPDPERICSFHLWRGRACDVLGRRDAARQEYHVALSGDPAVRQAARRGLQKPWKARRFGIDFTYADVIVP